MDCRVTTEMCVLYICAHIYIYVYMDVFMYVHTYTYAFMHPYIFVYLYVSISIYLSVCIHVYLSVSMYLITQGRRVGTRWSLMSLPAQPTHWFYTQKARWQWNLAANTRGVQLTAVFVLQCLSTCGGSTWTLRRKPSRTCPSELPIAGGSRRTWPSWSWPPTSCRASRRMCSCCLPSPC